MNSAYKFTFTFCKFAYIRRFFSSQGDQIRVRFAPSPTGTSFTYNTTKTACKTQLIINVQCGVQSLYAHSTSGNDLINRPWPVSLACSMNYLRAREMHGLTGPSWAVLRVIWDTKFNAKNSKSFLHIGGLRTALYNYMFAKSQNGVFVLRIEDTDQTRLVEKAVEKLEYDLQWAGLSPDEGPSKGGPFGPYLQSQRLPLYQAEVKKLLDNGSAYHCFCTDKRLEILRKDAIRRREAPRYDNRCRNLSQEEIKEKLESNVTYCIRFKLSPITEPFEDLVYGPVVINIAEIEGDPVIIKSDGYPTYHFANIVDDHHMRITHVLRGVEWQVSTTKHLLLYKAFNWNPPKYAHLPLLMNDDGKKLSKRNKNATVEAYRNDGVFPTALINFITSNGAGFPKTDIDSPNSLKSMDQLIRTFNLGLMNANNCQLQTDRLKVFNRAEMKILMNDETMVKEMVHTVRNLILQQYSLEKYELEEIDEHRLRHILKGNIDRIVQLSDLAGPNFQFLWTVPSAESLSKFEDKLFDFLEPLIQDIEKMSDYSEKSFEGNYFKDLSAANEMDYIKVMRFLRIALTGSKVGPSIVELFMYLGKNSILKRLKRAQLLRTTIAAQKEV